jgi:hypothetical protein
MPTIEQTVKAHFAKVFAKSDWYAFKGLADRYFERSARLRKSDMKAYPEAWRLLARNIEKRLFIGVGTELLLKALYLKHGFVINKPAKGKRAVPAFPFTRGQATGIQLAADETYTLNNLIQGLPKVPAIGTLGQLERGLLIAKVFRNKEGHVVLIAHKFDPQEYRDVEQSLVAIYARGFGQTLQVRFSVAHGEKAAWELSGVGDLTSARGRRRPPRS